MADITGNVTRGVQYSPRTGRYVGALVGKNEQKGIGALTRDLLERVGSLEWLTGAEAYAAVVASGLSQPTS
jgi:hypothetical protein